MADCCFLSCSLSVPEKVLLAAFLMFRTLCWIKAVNDVANHALSGHLMCRGKNEGHVIVGRCFSDATGKYDA